MPKFKIDAMRVRLTEALKYQGRSMADVSSSAGLSKSYLHNILKRNQSPAIDKLERICRELQVSPLWVIYGLDFPDGAEEVFIAMRKEPDRFWALMKLHF